MAQEFSLSIIFKAIDKLTAPMRKMGNSFRRQTRTVARFAVSLRKLGRLAVKTGQKLINMGKSLSLKLTAPIVLFGRKAILTARDFELAMNFVQAVTNATDDEFKLLNKTARDLGRTTQFSAIQAAEAMKFLGLAGLKTNDIVGAMPKVLELAASAQLDLASAADIVTNIMFGLGKKTSELSEVNDVLVNAFTKAKVDLTSLGQAFRKAGTTLKTAGIDFKTTTALLQALGQVGDVGGIAGRGLTRMTVELGKLRNASKKEIRLLKRIGIKPKQLFDINGQLIDMVEIIRLFGKSKIDLISATELLGRLGGPALLKLLESGADQVEKNRRGLDEIGISARVAQSQMRGLPGIIKRLVSVWESFNIALVKSGFDEKFARFTTKLSNFIEKLSEVNPEILNTIATILAFLAIVGPILIGLGAIVKALGFLILGFLAFWKVLALFTLGHPLIALITLLGLGAVWLLSKWEPVKEFFEDLKNLIPTGIREFFSPNLPNVTSSVRQNLITQGGIVKSQADINIKVSSERGSVATIEKVVKKGNANIEINSAAFVGALP